MTQFRKFEIDAMVDGVCTKILCNAEHVETQFKNQLSYAVMEERLNDLKEAKAESKKADEKAERIRKLLTNDVDSFNDMVIVVMTVFNLKLLSMVIVVLDIQSLVS